MSPLVIDLAVELGTLHGGSAVAWQEAIEACGSPERATWLVENPPAGLALSEWSPDRLIVAHITARLLEDGPGGIQSVYATPS